VTDRVKYPRTMHLPWSPGLQNDDRVIKSLDRLIGRTVVVTEKMDDIFDINKYIGDGFQKVCDVKLSQCIFSQLFDVDGEPGYVEPNWDYCNIDQSLMFSKHRSWVYAIVVENKIVKIGETGNPLGIRYINSASIQPKHGTKSRFGRYRKFRTKSDTDSYIRDSLVDEVAQGKVSLWALQCPIKMEEIYIVGKLTTVKSTMHKNIEQAYLVHFKEKASLPRLNKATI